jgi:hypothetical protein
MAAAAAAVPPTIRLNWASTVAETRTTPEQRFTRPQIQTMLEQAGFVDWVFRDGAPYWCAVGTKAGRAQAKP